LLATAHWYDGDPGEVKLWDAKTGTLVASLPAPIKDAGIIDMTFSPDGKILAGSVGSLPNPWPPGVVVLWDVAGCRELKVLRGHSARITALAFAPDGQTLTSGGEDRTVRFWDVASGRETGRIDGNSGWVRSLAYSRRQSPGDQQRLYTQTLGCRSESPGRYAGAGWVPGPVRLLRAEQRDAGRGRYSRRSDGRWLAVMRMAWIDIAIYEIGPPRP
jgi:hypothetical protein